MASHDDESGHDADGVVAAARLRGRRMALMAVVVVSVAFVASSALQIVPAVFGSGFTPLPSGAAPGSPEQRCAAGVRSLADALDRAGSRLASVARPTRSSSAGALTPGLSPEWDSAGEVQSACTEAQGGPQAWASLQRLRMAEEQWGRLDRDDIEAVRRDVAAHLPADLR
jgi:hypothetical protein